MGSVARVEGELVEAFVLALLAGVIAGLIVAAIIRNQIDTGLRRKTAGLLGL